MQFLKSSFLLLVYLLIFNLASGQESNFLVYRKHLVFSGITKEDSISSFPNAVHYDFYQSFDSAFYLPNSIQMLDTILIVWGLLTIEDQDVEFKEGAAGGGFYYLNIAGLPPFNDTINSFIPLPTGSNTWSERPTRFKYLNKEGSSLYKINLSRKFIPLIYPYPTSKEMYFTDRINETQSFFAWNLQSNNFNYKNTSDSIIFYLIPIEPKELNIKDIFTGTKNFIVNADSSFTCRLKYTDHNKARGLFNNVVKGYSIEEQKKLSEFNESGGYLTEPFVFNNEYGIFELLDNIFVSIDSSEDVWTFRVFPTVISNLTPYEAKQAIIKGLNKH